MHKGVLEASMTEGEFYQNRTRLKEEEGMEGNGGNRQARDVKTSRTLVLQTKSSLRLDCRIQAGLYTGWWLSILISRTMGTCLNRRTMDREQWGGGQ